MPGNRFSDCQFGAARSLREGGFCLSLKPAHRIGSVPAATIARSFGYENTRFRLPPVISLAIPIWLRCCNEAVTVGTDSFNAFDMAPIFAIGRFCIYSCPR